MKIIIGLEQKIVKKKNFFDLLNGLEILNQKISFWRFDIFFSKKKYSNLFY